MEETLQHNIRNERMDQILSHIKENKTVFFLDYCKREWGGGSDNLSEYVQLKERMHRLDLIEYKDHSKSLVALSPLGTDIWEGGGYLAYLQRNREKKKEADEKTQQKEDREKELALLSIQLTKVTLENETLKKAQRRTDVVLVILGILVTALSAAVGVLFSK